MLLIPAGFMSLSLMSLAFHTHWCCCLGSACVVTSTFSKLEYWKCALAGCSSKLACDCVYRVAVACCPGPLCGNPRLHLAACGSEQGRAISPAGHDTGLHGSTHSTPMGFTPVYPSSQAGTWQYNGSSVPVLLMYLPFVSTIFVRAIHGSHCSCCLEHEAW